MGGKVKVYFLVQWWVGGSKMAVLGRTYFMDGLQGKFRGIDSYTIYHQVVLPKRRMQKSLKQSFDLNMRKTV